MAIISSPHSETAINGFRLDRFQMGPIWHTDVPASLAEHCPSCEDSGGWTAWAAHLQQRRRPRNMARLFKSRVSPLEWSLTGESGAPTVRLIAGLYGSGSKKDARDADCTADLEAWLADADAGPMNDVAALEHLAWCWTLPRLARHAPAGLWWRLLGHLLRASEEAADVELFEQPLMHQLLAGELSLTLARQFPELSACRARAASGKSVLSQGLKELIDDRGLKDPRHIELLRPLLGCWTRYQLIATDLGCDRSDSDDDGYRAALTQALRLTRFDGSQALTPAPASDWNAEMFQAAILSSEAADLQHVAAECLPPLDLSSPKRRPKPLPSPAGGSEPARLGILRSNWSRRSELLAVRYAGREVEIELNIGRDRLWSGTWELSVRAAGQLLGQKRDWEEVCWFSDDDVDYLELECRLEHDVRVQRQLLLARCDRVLLLADAVLGAEPQKLDYCSKLPLLPGVAFLPADETCEGRIAARKRQALVLPLALPEWRSDPRGGLLALYDGRLELRQSASGSSLYAPMFFDLDRRRRKRPFTWRRLTVADDRVIQPADVACGYRVQIGGEQWLIYRSLAERRARTLLGHHVNTEFLLGRFSRRGEVQRLIEVE